MKSAYEILGVARDAPPEEIRRAYRAIARREHPDRHGGAVAANEQFLEIKAAYELLIDPDSRSAYDRDPTGKLEVRLIEEQRAAQRLRRRKRLKKLYE